MGDNSTTEPFATKEAEDASKTPPEWQHIQAEQSSGTPGRARTAANPPTSPNLKRDVVDQTPMRYGGLYSSGSCVLIMNSCPGD